MKANLVVKILMVAAASSLVACGNSDVGFDSQAAAPDMADKASSGNQKRNEANLYVSPNSGVDFGQISGTPGTSTGGSAGTDIGYVSPGPQIVDDLAGEYEYKSATLTFKMSLVNKQIAGGNSSVAWVEMIPNKHHVTVQAPNECQATGDEVESFIYENATSKSGSIAFKNFISTKLGACEKTTKAVTLLQLAKSFSVNLAGDLTITLSDSRVLRLKSVPIDWNNVIGL